jgi:hypothetical protein
VFDKEDGDFSVDAEHLYEPVLQARQETILIQGVTNQVRCQVVIVVIRKPNLVNI